MKFISPEDLPLLEALARLSPGSSKTTLRSWLQEARVTLDDELVKLSHTLVLQGQVVKVGEKPRFFEEGIKILFEDKHLVVIDKPSGMLSVSTAFEKGKTAHALLKKKYRPNKVFVVHRLDQDTSGVMLFALNETCYEKLKKIFEAHALERLYCGIVEGTMSLGSGTWESYLLEDGNYVVRETLDPHKGQLAITHYEVTAASKKNAWINLKLETGRKNQIRVHCQSAGHPIVGDKKYGAATNPIKRLCLHARVLAFEHPMTQKELRFESTIPQEFSRILKHS